jgi:hypothetical protein
MTAPPSLFAGLLLLVGIVLAGIVAAAAAPNIPSSELPGREHQRFLESPVERYMQPAQPTEPLIRWQCEPRNRQSKQSKKARSNRAAC